MVYTGRHHTDAPEFQCASLPTTAGLVQAVKEAVQIPVFCMVRPRGGDFCYSKHEIRVRKHHLTACLAL
jgi:copper homeostasis protein CutC